MLEIAGRILKWWRRNAPEKPVAKKAVPILEFHRHRGCPERSRLNETLTSTGFIAEDGSLRVFYNEDDVAVEIECNGKVMDLRDAHPYFANWNHWKWGLGTQIVRVWSWGHGVNLEVPHGWICNNWKRFGE